MRVLVSVPEAKKLSRYQQHYLSERFGTQMEEAKISKNFSHWTECMAAAKGTFYRALPNLPAELPRGLTGTTPQERGKALLNALIWYNTMVKRYPLSCTLPNYLPVHPAIDQA